MKFHPRFVEQTGGCVEAWCSGTEFLLSPVVVGAMMCVGMILLAVSEVQTAIQSCQDERERVAAERDAFQTFQTHIERIDPVELDPVDARTEGLGTQPHAMEQSTNLGDTTLKDVLSAYEDSVRSLSHYKIGYDETLAESLAAELGEDVVTSLVANTVLTPALQQTLLERSQNAIDARTALIDAISAEMDSLIEIQAELTDIEAQQEKLRAHLDSIETCHRDAAFDVWCRLYELETELDRIAQQRQATLEDPPVNQTVSTNTAVEHVDFYEYLYGESHTPRYPVLSAIGTLGTQVRAERDQVGTHFE